MTLLPLVNPGSGTRPPPHHLLAIMPINVSSASRSLLVPERAINTAWLVLLLCRGKGKAFTFSGICYFYKSPFSFGDSAHASWGLVR